MTKNLTGKHFMLDLRYNTNGAKEPYPPAIPNLPDLGWAPHAQIAMEALGITYLGSVPMSMFDSWHFHHCDKVPEILPKWLRPIDLPDAHAEYLGFPLEPARQKSKT